MGRGKGRQIFPPLPPVAACLGWVRWEDAAVLETGSVSEQNSESQQLLLHWAKRGHCWREPGN